jgi:hypothetical protein
MFTRHLVFQRTGHKKTLGIPLIIQTNALIQKKTLAIQLVQHYIHVVTSPLEILPET